MCVRWTVLLCALAVLAPSVLPSPVSSEDELSLAQRWTDIIKQYAHDAATRSSQPTRLTVDLPDGGSGQSLQLPLLVVPVPVPAENGPGCEANAGRIPPPPAPHSPHSHEPQYDVRQYSPAVSQSLDYDVPEPLPTFEGVVTSDQLLASFLTQRPTAPHLPPAVIPAPPPALAPAAAGDTPPSAQYLPPAEPRFPPSLYLSAVLTVKHADYSEPYQVWYDESSGATRVQFHQDGTSTFHLPQGDGTMQHLEIRQERTGEAERVLCATSSPAPAPATASGTPGLPDLQQFSFADYVEEDGVSAERWTYSVQGRAGQEGGARGEALTFRHDLLLARRGEYTTPLRYTVSVDSSVLGADCDHYEHRYLQLRPEQHAPDTFAVDIQRTCEEVEQVDMLNPVIRARLEPLREFTLPVRDPRYDQGVEDFKKEFERKYIDDIEESIRKNLFVQHTRFVTSLNREGATFETEINFLGDRLDAELDVLLGTLYEERVEGRSGGASGAAAAGEKGGAGGDASDLPDEFDWRPVGGVTPVRYQGSCSSCWAFAVTGSVEGALFARTGQLVPLSEQCLVDCAHSHGAHGCSGTWPSHAYDYIKDRGLPAQAEYTPYMEKVLRCRDREVPPVTHINGYVNVSPNNTDALKVAIRRHAPTVVVVDARPKSFMFYKKGVLRDDRCLKGPNKKLNHAVLAVGWGAQRGEPHFILKNTYSARWGDAGYIRLHAPSNTCGHLSIPSYARLARPDVDRLPQPSLDQPYPGIQ